MSAIVRKNVSERTQRQLARFYDGQRCIITGIKSSPHHLNGRPDESNFENLVPLNLEFHNGLRTKGETPDNLKPALRTDELIAAGRLHFAAGRLPQAYGCLRLAYSIYAHYYIGREPEGELSTAAHCLYFLRRSATTPVLDLIWSRLRWIIEREIQSTITAFIHRPPFGEFCLLTELASWLSEFGWPEPGVELLRMANERLEDVKRYLSPADVSRFKRQLANSLIQQGQHGVELEMTLEGSAEWDNKSENNKFALYSTRLNRCLSKEDTNQSMAVLDERFDYFERHTDYCCGSLVGIGMTIQTSLDYIARSILVQSQVSRFRKQRELVMERIAALEKQEKRYGVTARLHRIPNLGANIKRASLNIPAMDRFLDNRVFPELPPRLAELVFDVAIRL